MELIENEQNDKTTITKRDYLFLYLMEWGKKRRNEGDLISFHPIFWADFECSLQDQLHLESENGSEMKK